VVKSERKGEAPPLAREEWDFGSCPEGRELYCWGYEYARESAAIIADYRDCKERPESGCFDEHGNWSDTISIFDSDGELDEQIAIELAPGFPEVPYLKTKHVPWKWEGEPLDLEFLAGAPVRDAGKLENYYPQPAPHYFAHLYIGWEAADKTLLRAFGRWLKGHRPFPARTKRGKSPAREFMADLRALGAWRLLQRMSAREALEHTSKFVRGGLYAKIPDWYGARRRALRVLGKYFSAV
jgi:hypothetical protein